MFTFLCVMRILRSITIKKASSRRSLMSLCYKTISSCRSCAYVEILSTWEVGRALKRLELHSAAPRATLTPLSCSPNFPRAQYLDIRTLMHELIVNYRCELLAFVVVASQQTNFGRVRHQPGLPAPEASITAFASISSNRNRGSFDS